MKIISVDLARVINLFPLSELNSMGKSHSATFLELAKRYKFQKYPKHIKDAASDNSLTFDGGEFRNKIGVEVSIKLKLYSDGIVADCWSSTTDAEDFLSEMLRWLCEQHDLKLPDDRSIKNFYLSQLIVTTDKQLTILSPRLKTFSDYLSSKTTDGSKFDLGSIGFWHGNEPSNFVFEKKIGALPEEKRYFTSAPFTTEGHCEALHEFERLLT